MQQSTTASRTRGFKVCSIHRRHHLNVQQHACNVRLQTHPRPQSLRHQLPPPAAQGSRAPRHTAPQPAQQQVECRQGRGGDSGHDGCLPTCAKRQVTGRCGLWDSSTCMLRPATCTPTQLKVLPCKHMSAHLLQREGHGGSHYAAHPPQRSLHSCRRTAACQRQVTPQQHSGNLRQHSMQQAQAAQGYFQRAGVCYLLAAVSCMGSSAAHPWHMRSRPCLQWPASQPQSWLQLADISTCKINHHSSIRAPPATAARQGRVGAAKADGQGCAGTVGRRAAPGRQLVPPVQAALQTGALPRCQFQTKHFRQVPNVQHTQQGRPTHLRCPAARL